MIERDRILRAARSFMGTRWRHQARMPGVGLDCIGVIGMAAVYAGVPGADEWLRTPEFHNYARTPDPALLISGCDHFLDRIPVDQAKPADVLIMAFAREPQHFALVSRIDPTYIIHAYAQVRRVVENGVNVAGARVLRAYAFRGVESWQA